MAKNGVPTSAWVFESFDFKWDEEFIIKELLGWSGNIFSWINFWSIIDHTDFWKDINKEIDLLKPEIKNIIKKWWNIPKAPEVEKIINGVALKVKDILIRNWLGVPSWNELVGPPMVDKIVNGISYRTMIYWVLKVLESTWIKTKVLNPKDVPNETWKVIYDILKDPALTSLLIVLKSYGIIDFSWNKWNKFEYEEEVKICNIWDKKEDIIKKLEERWAKKTFEWTVEDKYYDYPDKKNKLKEKSDSSFRIRTKTDQDWNKKYYYTIKKELSDLEKKELIANWVMRDRVVGTRICKEKEFEINDIDKMEKIIHRFGLIESKRKVKHRISYAYYEKWNEENWIKFDFDKYDGKQEMVEVEASMGQSINEWINHMWIQNEDEHPRMVTWSWKFMRDKKTDEPQK